MPESNPEEWPELEGARVKLEKARDSNASLRSAKRASSSIGETSSVHHAQSLLILSDSIASISVQECKTKNLEVVETDTGVSLNTIVDTLQEAAATVLGITPKREDDADTVLTVESHPAPNLPEVVDIDTTRVLPQETDIMICTNCHYLVPLIETCIACETPLEFTWTVVMY